MQFLNVLCNIDSVWVKILIVKVLKELLSELQRQCNSLQVDTVKVFQTLSVKAFLMKRHNLTWFWLRISMFTLCANTTWFRFLGK